MGEYHSLLACLCFFCLFCISIGIGIGIQQRVLFDIAASLWPAYTYFS